MAERPRVYATRPLPGDALERLGDMASLEVWPEPGGPPPEELAAGVREAEGLVCLLTERVDAALLARCPRLRAISSVSVGVDHVDLAAATERGIPVGYTPGVLTETTAELTFALLLAAARRVAEGDRWVRRGAWTPRLRWEPDLLLGRDLFGATLGVVGLGPIGRAVARRAHAFGMRVLGWSRRRRSPEEAGGAEWAELPDLLRGSDFVSLHVALAPETRHLIDAEALARMKRGSILVNTARGPVVDEGALVEALRRGPLAAAGLDVFEQEPLPPASPLLELENVVLTPHVGSASVATRSRMASVAVENLIAGLEGRPMPHCANPEVYGPEMECR